jgi:hypothetical protein
MKRAYSLCLVLLLLASGAQADIYKCVADDGSVSYSQIPCPEEKTETVRTVTSRRSEPADCRWATQFAGEVARRMRTGKDSASLFDLYGGVDSVSNGTVNVINYVYRFRSDDSIAVERIASLAGNMCKAGSLGDVSCESLPYGQDPTGKRCNPDDEDAATTIAAVGSSNGSAPLGTNRPPAQQEPANSNPSRIVSNADSAEDTAKTEACKKRYRDQIDAIDARMRSGYDSEQGEVYRERLRTLTTRLREC